MDKNILEMIREIRSINHPSSITVNDILKISDLCIKHKPKKEIIHKLDISRTSFALILLE